MTTLIDVRQIGKFRVAKIGDIEIVQNPESPILAIAYGFDKHFQKWKFITPFDTLEGLGKLFSSQATLDYAPPYTRSIHDLLGGVSKEKEEVSLLLGNGFSATISFQAGQDVVKALSAHYLIS